MGADLEVSPPAHSRPKGAKLEEEEKEEEEEDPLELDSVSEEDVCRSWIHLQRSGFARCKAVVDLPVRRSGSTLLHMAAAGAHVATLQYLLALGAGVDARDKEGMTPLMCLVAVAGLSREAEEAASVLIQAGCNRNIPCQTSRGRLTPVMAAARRNSIRMVDMLLQAGASMVAVVGGGVVGDGDTDTVLMVALRQGSCEVAWHVLNHYPRRASVNHQSRLGGETALHLAVCCRRQQREITELLLRCGADVRLVSADQHTPLTLAVARGALDVTEAILLHHPGMLAGPLSHPGGPAPCWQSALLYCVHPPTHSRHNGGDGIPMMHLLLRHGAPIDAALRAMSALDKSLAVKRVDVTHFLVLLGCRVRDTVLVRSFLASHQVALASGGGGAQKGSGGGSPSSFPPPALLAPVPHESQILGLDSDWMAEMGQSQMGQSPVKDAGKEEKIRQISAYLSRHLQGPPSLHSLCLDAVRHSVRRVGHPFQDAARLPLPESVINAILYRGDPRDESNVIINGKQ